MSITSTITSSITSAIPSQIPGAVAIQLSANTAAEDASVGTLIGNLSVLNGSGSYTFTIDSDPDSKFQLDAGDDSILEVGAALDYETATSHTVTIQADNGVDTPFTRQFTINVTDVFEPSLVFNDARNSQYAPLI